MTNALANVAIVLHQPQDVVNVAAIVRVMSNFGLADLRLVEPAAFDAYRILGIAHHTENIVERVQRFPTLAAATADCALLLGTTGRPRAVERLILGPRQAAPMLLTAADAGPAKVAVLFGTERTGLPNDALDQCHGVIAIPTHPGNRSLNLAQAALVICYELWMAASEPAAAAPPLPDEELAPGLERAAMFEAVTLLLGALYPDSAPARMEAAASRLKSMLMRSAPTKAEAQAFANLCRHAVRALDKES